MKIAHNFQRRFAIANKQTIPNLRENHIRMICKVAAEAHEIRGLCIHVELGHHVVGEFLIVDKTQ